MFCSALREFLAHLGFRPYHYSDMICAYQRDIPLWTEAIQAKYQGKGELYGREEFDKLLGDFDVRTSPFLFPLHSLSLTGRSSENIVHR